MISGSLYRRAGLGATVAIALLFGGPGPTIAATSSPNSMTNTEASTGVWCGEPTDSLRSPWNCFLNESNSGGHLIINSGDDATVTLQSPNPATTSSTSDSAVLKFMGSSVGGAYFGDYSAVGAGTATIMAKQTAYPGPGPCPVLTYSWSVEVRTVTPGAPSAPPSIQASLGHTLESPEIAKLTWTFPPGDGHPHPVSWAVYAFSYTGAPAIQSYTSNLNQYDFATLTGGSYYIFTVVGWNGQWGAWSPWSNWLWIPPY